MYNLKVLVYVDNMRHWPIKVEMCIENINHCVMNLKSNKNWIFYPYTAQVMMIWINGNQLPVEPG